MKTIVLKRKALVLSLAMAFIGAMTLTQCKKEKPTVTPTEDPTEIPTDTVSTPEGETVHITLKVNQDNDEKLTVNPPHVSFNDEDVLFVASHGKYVGIIVYDEESSEFSGTITGATSGEPLYFYLLGNRKYDDITDWTEEGGAKIGCSFNISNQYNFFTGQPADKQLPVVSCAPSNENYNYDGAEPNSEFTTTEFTAILRNKCALVKFNVIPSTFSSITLSGVKNVVTINFNPTNEEGRFAYSESDGGGSITVGKRPDGYWAILLPHDGEITATASAAGYDDASVTIPAINNNDYLDNGITVSLNENPLATPLTFEAKTAGATVSFNIYTSAATNPVQYSTDGSTWNDYTSNTTINLTNVGDKVSFRGNNAAYANEYGYSKFSCTGECYIYGNIMSLINANNYPTATELTCNNTFYNLFYENSNIYNYPTKALSLPATTITESCYYCMFNGCSNLTSAPELPALALAPACYYEMFSGCTSLNSVTCLATDISATDCTENWLNNVATTGTFTKAASMSSWGSGASGIPSGWTVVDYTP